MSTMLKVWETQGGSQIVKRMSQWRYASFQAWRDVLTLVFLILYVDIIYTWSGLDIPITITNKNCQMVRAFHHGTF